MYLLLSILMLFSGADAKVAVTAVGSNPDSQVDARFGRAAWYLIYDPAAGTWEAINHSENLPSGAGPDAVAELKARGVKVVITGQCGPNALGALQSAGIKVYRASDCTVAEALRDYEGGRLKPIE